MTTANPADSAVTYDIEHVTHYDYSAPVVHAHHMLHLTPRAHALQRVLDHAIEMQPTSGRWLRDQDSFGNPVARVELDRPHEHLTLTARSRLQVIPQAPIDAGDSWSWERVREVLSYQSRPRGVKELEALSYRLESPHVRIKNSFSEFAADCFAAGQPVLVCAEALMRKIHSELTYAPGATQVNTSLLAVLETRRGVCQDYSHLMLACLRSMGLAARYVSGYLRTTPPEGEKALVGADASHAWISVYAPPFDWVDLDPTNNVRVNTDHLTLAWGRDFSDVSPVRGVIVGGGQHMVSVGVAVKLLAPIK